MVDSTTDDAVLTHDGVAERLREMADEFESDERPEVNLGDETHTVTPTDYVNWQVTVSKNKSIISENAEAITVELSWELDE